MRRIPYLRVDNANESIHSNPRCPITVIYFVENILELFGTRKEVIDIHFRTMMNLEQRSET